MTPDISLLREAGEALYGSRWQSELARQLGIGDRRVREYVGGERSIPERLWPEIRAMMRAKRAALATAERKLPR